MVPNAKFSTRASEPASTLWMTATPAFDLRSIDRLRLLRLKTGKIAEPKPTLARVRSPSSGSTLMTSAPRSASTMEHEGPMTVWPISSTRIPASGSSPPLRSGAFMPSASPLLARRGAQLRQTAAELDRAGQRVADDVFGETRAFEQIVEIEPGIA